MLTLALEYIQKQLAKTKETFLPYICKYYHFTFASNIALHLQAISLYICKQYQEFLLFC